MGTLWLGPALGILALVLGGLFLLRRSNRLRAREVQRARVDELVCALCDLNAQVAADSDLAALLIDFTESPRRLARVERVRARAWFDAARRLHRLLHAALEGLDDEAISRAMWAPSMGESAGPAMRRSASHGPQLGEEAGSGAREVEGIEEQRAFSNVTLIDPEFQAWVEAMREIRRA